MNNTLICWQTHWPKFLIFHLALVLVGQHLLAEQYQWLGLLKFSLNLVIFLSALHTPVSSQLVKDLKKIFVLIFLADFFFVFLGVLPGFSPEMSVLKLAGSFFFGCAYIGLMGLVRNWSGKKQLERGPTLLILIALAFYSVVAWKKNGLAPGALVFFLFVGVMGATLVSAGHQLRQQLKGQVGRTLIMVGTLFFSSEMIFGLANFMPGWTRNDPWLGNLIWLTYIPGWILMLRLLKIGKLR